MELMADLVKNNNDVLCDSVSVSSLKVWHLIPDHCSDSTLEGQKTN